MPGASVKVPHKLIRGTKKVRRADTRSVKYQGPKIDGGLGFIPELSRELKYGAGADGGHEGIYRGTPNHARE